MAATLEDLKAYVGVEDSSLDVLLTSCLSDAVSLVDQYVREAAVPENILDRCYLIVGYDLYERRNAPNGIVNAQFQGVDGIGQNTARIARDPLAGVYPILRRFVLPW